MGISSLINPEENEIKDVAIASAEYQDVNATTLFNPQTYSVAAITIANGSDNISVYIPLFASSNLGNSIIIIGVFLILIALWCYLAYKFTYQTKIAHRLSKYGSYILPFVLIILGVIIVLKTEALSLIKLAAISICLGILVKKR